MGKRGKVINPKSFSRNRGVASDDMDDEIDACKQSSFSVSFSFFPILCVIIKQRLELGDGLWESVFIVFCGAAHNLDVVELMIHLIIFFCIGSILSWEREKKKLMGFE